MKQTIKYLVLCTLTTISISSYGVRAPEWHNIDDLNALTRFINKHPKVLAGLKRIDIKKQRIIFSAAQPNVAVVSDMPDKGNKPNDNLTNEHICTINFYKHPLHFFGFGPKGGLVFKSATCDID